jgi:hypothetical protein
MLLDRRSLDTYADFLSWIWISVAGLRQATLEKMVSRVDVATVGRNIRHVHALYPDIRIHLEMTVCPTNRHEAVDFIAWGFGELGVDSINLRRIVVTDTYHRGSYLASNIGDSAAIGLTTAQWTETVEAVLSRYRGDRRKATIVGTLDRRTRAEFTDTIELTAGEHLAAGEARRPAA